MALVRVLVAALSCGALTAQWQSIVDPEPFAVRDAVARDGESGWRVEKGRQVCLLAIDETPAVGAWVLVRQVGAMTRVSAERRRELAKLGEGPRTVALARELRTWGRAGGGGSLRLPAGPCHVVVLWRGNAFARSLDGSEAQLRLPPVRDRIQVRVRDPKGQPLADVRVRLENSRKRRAPERWTDETGCVAFTLPERARPPELGVRAFDEVQRSVVDAEANGTFVSVGDHGSGCPLDVVLAGFGKLRAILYDSKGRPLPSVGSVYARTDDFRWQDGAPTQKGSVATFSNVPLGESVLLEFTVTGMAGFFSVEVPGPTRPGETCVAPVRLGDGMIVGKLIVQDPGGKPLAKAEVRLGRIADSDLTVERVHTGPDGEITVLFSAEDTAGDEDDDDRPRVFVQSGDLDQGAGEGVAGGLVVPVLAPGIHDLGVVRLAEQVVAIRGRVVDPDGKPVPSVLVGTAHSLDSAVWTLESWDDLPEHEFTHRVRTNADGEFVMRQHTTDLIDDPLPIFIHDDNYMFADSVIVIPGGDPVELEVTPVGTMSATMKGAPMSGLGMELVAVRQGGDEEDDAFVDSVWLADGACRDWRLPAGTYDLELRMSRYLAGVEIGGVVVPAKGKASDPRLRAIDWSAHARRVDVTVLMPDGSPLRGGGSVQCRVPHSGGWTGSGGRTDDRGRVAFFASHRGSRICVEIPGMLPVDVPVAEDRMTVRLERAPLLAVRAQGSKPLPRGVRLQFGFRVDGKWEGPTGVLTQGVEARLPLRQLGRQSVVFRLEQRQVDGCPAAVRDALRALKFEVAVAIHPTGLDPVVRLDLALSERQLEVLQEAGKLLARRQ